MKNFGLIKTIFTNLMAEGVVEKDLKKKKIFSDFVKKIKTNKILKQQFQVYDLLENINDSDAITINNFIREALNLLEGVNKDTLILENAKLLSPLIRNNYSLENIEYPEKELHESISEIIFTNKTAKTINSIVEHTGKICEFVKNKEIIVENKGFGVPNSMLTSMLVNKFNDKYIDLSENEKIFLRGFIKNDENENREFYTKLIGECLELINNRLITSDIELKESLLDVKEKLLTSNFMAESYSVDALKLIELKDDLNN